MIQPERDNRPVDFVMVTGGECATVFYPTADKLLQAGKRIAIVQYPGYGADSNNIGMTDCIGELRLIARAIGSLDLSPTVRFIGHSLGGLALLGILNRPWARQYIRWRFDKTRLRKPDLILFNLPLSLADPETDKYCRYCWTLSSLPCQFLRPLAPIGRSLVHRSFVERFPSGEVPSRAFVQQGMHTRWPDGMPAGMLEETEKFLPVNDLVRTAQNYFELLIRALYAVRHSTLSISIVDGGFDTFAFWPPWADYLVNSGKCKRAVIPEGTHFIPATLDGTRLKEFLEY